jgi:hypothetical protein
MQCSREHAPLKCNQPAVESDKLHPARRFKQAQRSNFMEELQFGVVAFRPVGSTRLQARFLQPKRQISPDGLWMADAR